MAEYVDRERQLAGKESAVVARSQISVAVDQESIASNQLHIEVQQLRSSFEAKARLVTGELSELDRRCQTSAPAELIATEMQERKATC